MLVVLYVIAASLPWALVESKGCWAEPRGRQDACLYGTIMPGGNENEISYNLTVESGSRICCEAYSCSNNKCGLVIVGCHKNGNVPITIPPLPWEVPASRSVEPIMKCFDSMGKGVYYTFTAERLLET